MFYYHIIKNENMLFEVGVRSSFIKYGCMDFICFYSRQVIEQANSPIINYFLFINVFVIKKNWHYSFNRYHGFIISIVVKLSCYFASKIMHTGLSLWKWKWSSNNTIHLTFAYIKKLQAEEIIFFFIIILKIKLIMSLTLLYVCTKW